MKKFVVSGFLLLGWLACGLYYSAPTDPNALPNGARLLDFSQLEPRAGEDEFEDDAEKREEWFRFQRTYPFNEIPADARRKAWQARPRGKVKSLALMQAPEGRWQPIGPFPTASAPIEQWGFTSGRINAIAVSPANAQIVLVGASTGGIWRSTDGGKNFTPVTNDQVEAAVGSLAFSKSNPDIVYAGMGDPKSVYDGSAVLRSTNAGATWTYLTPSPFVHKVGKIAVDDADPNRVYLIRHQIGFYLSTDGGQSWQEKLGCEASDMAIHPTDGKTIYVAAASRLAGDGPRFAFPGVHRSTDRGESWKRVYESPFFNGTANFKIATTPANPNVVYGIIGGNISGGNRSQVAEIRVLFSKNGGKKWKSTVTSDIDPGQFTYNCYIAADPLNADTVYVGTRDIYKSGNRGKGWSRVTRNFLFDAESRSWNYNPSDSTAHPDQHVMTFAPGHPATMYIGNDGGVYQSTDAGTSFQSLNATLSLTQFYAMALHPTDPTISYGGTQDNGSQRRLGNTNQWEEFIGGDGGHVVINPLNPEQVFATYIRTTIFRHEANGDTFVIGNNAVFGESDASPRVAFIAPFTGNGRDDTLYFGTWRLFMSKDRGRSWTAPAGNLDLTMGANFSDVLNTIAVSPSDPNFIYTGSQRGRLMASSDEGKTWRDVTIGIPLRTIKSIAIDPLVPTTAYIGLSGFRAGHVLKTINGGASWTDISGNLPDIPVNAVLIAPWDSNQLYIGTDVGVFRSTASGGEWETFNDGLPPVIVTDLEAQPNGVLQLATYGRGMYQLGGGENTEESFSLTVDRITQFFIPGVAVSFTIQSQRFGSFNQPITLAVSQLSALPGLSFELSANTVMPGEAVILTIRAAADTPREVSDIKIEGTAAGITRTLSITPTLLEGLPVSPTGPRITTYSISADASGITQTINGTGFGRNPRLLINGTPHPSFVKKANDTKIIYKGSGFEELGYRLGYNSIQVVNESGGASNLRVLKLFQDQGTTAYTRRP